MKAKLQLVETPSAVSNMVVKECKKAFNDALTRIANKAVPKIRELFSRAMQHQPEWRSLNNGQLAAEFGLADGSTRISTILQALINNVSVRRKKATGIRKLNAQITISMIPGDFNQILKLPAANVRTSNGKQLPWLEWLLIRGDQAIIRDYRIDYDATVRSRSGQAIMVSAQDHQWRVPPQYAGTQDNNFITRALDDAEPFIDKALLKIMRSELT